METDQIVNRVEKSGIITLDMKIFYQEKDKVLIDIKDQLFNGMILREKDYRTFIKEKDWSIYQNKYVAIYCSVDAIIPIWAYMLLASSLQPFARKIVFGDMNTLNEAILMENINSLNTDAFEAKKVVIKGCSDIYIPESAYVRVTERLLPIVSSLMYGEPCSTVPVYKRRK